MGFSEDEYAQFSSGACRRAPEQQQDKTNEVSLFVVKPNTLSCVWSELIRLEGELIRLEVSLYGVFLKDEYAQFHKIESELIRPPIFWNQVVPPNNTKHKVLLRADEYAQLQKTNTLRSDNSVHGPVLP
jgi:hypothetical protein